MEAIVEKTAKKMNGFLALLIIIVLVIIDIYVLRDGIIMEDTAFLWLFIPLIIITSISFGGFTVIQPNDSRVLKIGRAHV